MYNKLVPTIKEGYVLTRLWKKFILDKPLAIIMLGAFFMGVKCYGSTSVSKTESGGSTPSTPANKGL